MAQKNDTNDTELRKKLTPEQYRVTKENGTEPPFRNEYHDNHAAGIYVDVVSGEPVEIAEGSPVAMDALSFKVLVPADSPCLASLGDLP